MSNTGHKGTETFLDAITMFQNRSIHAYFAHCVATRQQWMQYQDFKRQSGWTTATDRKIRQHLVRLDRLRVKMIHTQGDNDQKIENLEVLAKELKLELPAANTNTLADSIARASGRPIEMRFRLDGTTSDVPAHSTLDLRNVSAQSLMQALDLHMVTATRLDSRNATHRITGEEGAQLFAGLMEMWSICDEFGGDEKIIGVTEGVLPSEEPQGPARSSAIKGGDESALRNESGST